MSNDPNDNPNPNDDNNDNDDDDDDFQQIEKEIASTLTDLSNPSQVLLADFAIEYDKLARALRSAHENEIRIEKKCLTLVNDAATIKEKARGEAGEQDELHSRKLHLTTEIEETWKGECVSKKFFFFLF